MLHWLNGASQVRSIVAPRELDRKMRATISIEQIEA